MNTEQPLTLLRERLAKVLNDVRASHFGPALRDGAEFVFNQADFFKREGDHLSHIRAFTLRWEVYDQAGEYKTALRLLQDMARQHLADFENADRRHFLSDGSTPETLIANRKLARQKVMCCLGYGFALYRLRKYDETETVFSTCASFLEKFLVCPKDASPFFCWGTRARLHYFRGHLRRVQGNFVSAREEFVKALDFAYRRLEEKRSNKATSLADLHIEEQFAKHCAGKVLGFGLGWTSLLQGKLAAAREQLQAARVVLNDSRDEYLKEQVEMLSCAVITAQNGKSIASEELLERIDKCAEKLRKHTEYYWQSQNEFAKASLNVARALWKTAPEHSKALLQVARTRVEKFLRSDSGTNQIIANVALSRISSAQSGDAWSQESEEFAQQAYNLAHQSASPAPAVALAAIALGESLGKGRSRESLQRGLRYLEEGLRASRQSLVAQMACHLHMVDIHLQLGNILHARQSFAAYIKHSSEIEHGWLLQRAAELAEHLKTRMTYIIDFADNRPYQSLVNDLFAFLIDREKLKQEREGRKSFSPDDAAANLRVTPKTFKEWQRKRDHLIDIELQFRLPKKNNSTE